MTIMNAENFLGWLNHIEVESSIFETRLKKSGDQPIDIDRIDLGNYENSLLEQVNERQDSDYLEVSGRVYVFLDEVCRTYLSASSIQRNAISKTFTNKKNILGFFVAYPSRVARFIETSNDLNWVQLGAVAALIEGGQTDCRDLWLSLGDLYTTAVDRGIDPVHQFELVESVTVREGDMYNSVHIGRGILSDFLKSEYLSSILS